MKRLFVFAALLIATHFAAAETSFMVPAGMPVTHQQLQAELDVKMQRVQNFLAEEHLGGVLLTRVDNVAWITGGLADNHIIITSENGASSLLILRGDKRYILGESGEVLRMSHEDLAGLGYEARPYTWYEDQTAPDRKLAILRELAHGEAIGTDVPYAGLKQIAAGFAPLRYQLTESEIAKYRQLGPAVTEAVIAVCRRIHPGMSEREIEAMASEELLKRGIRPTVLLMGVDHRVFDYYHHNPSDLRLQHYAIVNVCARRWGLVVSVARFVHFGPIDKDLERKEKATMEISARYEANSKPGVTSGAMLQAAQGWFRDQGFDGGWQDHHQGGAIGYAEREWVAIPGGKQVIQDHEAFAWNPIVQGTLSFDTILVDGNHIENLTRTRDWPTRTVVIDGVDYFMPDILIRPIPKH